MPLDAELSVLIGVVGWVKPSSRSVMHMGTTVYTFWNSTPTYSLARDATTCFRILHFLLIWPFSGGRRFVAFFRLVVSEIK